MRLLVLTSHADSLNSIRPEAEIFISMQELGVDVTVMTQADGVYNDQLRNAGVRLVNFVPEKKFEAAMKKFDMDSSGQLDIKECVLMEVFIEVRDSPKIYA